MTTYQAYVGPEENYYEVGPQWLKWLTGELGLQPSNRVLDVGCGSLRIGRCLIPFLDPGNYHGIEPEKKWLDEGLKQELSGATVEAKQPKFYHNSDFQVPSRARFDLVVASQVFIHCGFDQFKQCLESLQKHLARGGRFIATLKLGEEDKETPYPPGRGLYKFSDNSATVYTGTTLDETLLGYGFKRAPRQGREETSNRFVITRL